MSEPLSDARQTLLRALDLIEQLEQEMETEVRHIAVVFSVWKEDEDGVIHDNGGWCHTSDPAWLVAAMLRESADLIEMSPRRADAEDDDD